MKKVLTISAALGIATASLTAATSPTVWFQWTSGVGANNHWYGLSSDHDSWQAMHTMAVGFGYHLVSVNSAAEESFLHSTFGPQIDIPQEVEIPRQYVWIGYNDLVSEGDFEWTDGSLDSYNNWAPFEPNNSNDEDVTVLNWDGAGRWNDLPNSSGEGANFLALFESVDNPVPEASDAAAVGGLAVLALGIWRARRARA